MKIVIKILSILIISLLIQSSGKNLTQNKDDLIAKVIKYTRWSEKRNTSHFEVCVIGNSFEYYKKCCKNIKYIDGRKIVVRQIKDVNELKSAQVLIISESEFDKIELIIEKIKKKDVLTIGEAKGMAEKGAILNFYSVNNELIMEINEKYERISKIDLHPNLFRIAKVI